MLHVLRNSTANNVRAPGSPTSARAGRYAYLRVSKAGGLARDVVREDDGPHRCLPGVALAHQQHLLQNLILVLNQHYILVCLQSPLKVYKTF